MSRSAPAVIAAACYACGADVAFSREAASVQELPAGVQLLQHPATCSSCGKSQELTAVEVAGRLSGIEAKPMSQAFAWAEERNAAADAARAAALEDPAVQAAALEAGQKASKALAKAGLPDELAQLEGQRIAGRAAELLAREAASQAALDVAAGQKEAPPAAEA